MRIVGLTGGIGSGKSTVSDLFSQQGVLVVDTDLVAHELTRSQGAAMPSILAQFGPQFGLPDGALNRQLMRQHVFTHPEARVQLETILHPMIRSQCLQRLREALDRGVPYAMVVVPLLLESTDWHAHLGRVLVVDCTMSTQIHRVMRRNHLSEQEVSAIIQTQTSRCARLQAAHDVIVNESPKANLVDAVIRLHQQYLQLWPG